MLCSGKQAAAQSGAAACSLFLYAKRRSVRSGAVIIYKDAFCETLLSFGRVKRDTVSVGSSDISAAFAFLTKNTAATAAIMTIIRTMISAVGFFFAGAGGGEGILLGFGSPNMDLPQLGQNLSFIGIFRPHA